MKIVAWQLKLDIRNIMTRFFLALLRRVILKYTSPQSRGLFKN